MWLPIFANYYDKIIVKAILCNFSRYIGFVEPSLPVLMIKDVELIKQICVKDFDFFPEHQFMDIDEKNDPLFYNNLFSTKGKSQTLQKYQGHFKMRQF